MPIHFRAQSGNVTDDTTRRDTWDLLCQLAGRRDFLYVADSKLATSDNMRQIACHGGRFLSVLPRRRTEDTVFRTQLREGQVVWEPIWDKQDEEGRLLDRFSVCPESTVTAEGFRLVWYHSTRKAELDADTRAHKIDRALRRLGQRRQKLASPRTRYRQSDKVQRAVEDTLKECDAEGWIQVEILPREEEAYRQAKPGRPGKGTRYVRQVKTRLELRYEFDIARVNEASSGDGVFPLVTNVADSSPRELLFAYQRQPTIEKRFSQLKTDFAVAPVYLKEVRRIQALLCVYFFALLIEALLERELRRARQREEIEWLPMYPEGRRWPTARRLIDLFETVQRHMLTQGKRSPELMGPTCNANCSNCSPYPPPTMATEMRPPENSQIMIRQHAEKTVAQPADREHQGHPRPRDIFLASRHDAFEHFVEFQLSDQFQREPRPAEVELVFNSHVRRIDLDPFRLGPVVAIEQSQLLQRRLPLSFGRVFDAASLGLLELSQIGDDALS